MFSAHSYWSDAGTDDYNSYDAEAAYPEMGVNNVKPFIDWLRKHDAKGFVGEYCVPTTTRAGSSSSITFWPTWRPRASAAPTGRAEAGIRAIRSAATRPPTTPWTVPS